MQPDDYKSIDLYLQKELSPDELKTFHDRLQNDQAFADELNMRQGMDSYLKAKASQPELEKKMASLGKKHFQTEAKVRSLPNIRWLVGIAAAALIGLMLWLWNPFTSPDLYAQYAQHPDLVLAERGEDGNLASKAEAAFAAGAYPEAYELLQTMVAEKPTDMQLLLALGIAALESGKQREAEAAFTKVAASNASLQSYGNWYLALSAVKSGSYEKAKLLLQKIDDSDPVLKRKAEQLLRAL
jgi:tetratricopeptide (TPR) repeat protein